VVGLNPTKEKHEIVSIFEPVSSFLLCTLKTWLKVNMGPFPWLGPYIISMSNTSQEIPYELTFKSFVNTFRDCPEL
jgi:hypothetical protein